MEKQKNKAAEALRSHFTAPRIAYMAIFTALAFAVTFLEFPIFPQANFLKLDFANIFFMIEGYIFGPVEAIISIAVKELLCLTKTSTMGVGEVANFIMSTAYVIVPSVAYRFLKGRKWAVLFMAVGCLLQIAVGVVVNRYINFPLYGSLFGFDGVATFAALWPFVVYFNIIKSVAISVVVFLIYKPLSRFIHMTSEKFSNRKRRNEQPAVAAAEGAENAACVSPSEEKENTNP